MYSKVFYFIGDKKKTVGGGRREEAKRGGSREFIRIGLKLEACVVFSSVTNADSVRHRNSIEPRTFCSQTSIIKLSVRIHTVALLPN